MIDLSNEQILSLADGAKLPFLPARRGGKRTHLATLYRWSQIGCKGIKLETIQIGATRCTSREAVERFILALTAQAQGVSPSPAPLKKERGRAIAAAEQRLIRAGA